MKLSIEGEDIAVFVGGDQNSLLDGLFPNFLHLTLAINGVDYSSNRKSYDGGRDDHADDAFDFVCHN